MSVAWMDYNSVKCVCKVVQNGVVKKSIWCEIAVWCRMSWCGFKCFVVWIRLCVAFRAVLCSVQCNVSQFSIVYVSVGFSVHSAVQCQSIASAQFYSVQCKQCSESIASVQFLKRSVFRVECSIQSVVISVSWVRVYGVHGLPTIIQCL